MARLAALARRLRAQAEAEGRRVFLWDAGDAADRRERICSATKGAATAPILTAMGYTLQTVGNDLSLPYGPQVLEEFAARGGFPLLAANLRNGEEPPPPGVREHVRVPLENGLEMGVFGLTAPWDGLYKIFGLETPDTFETARAQVAALRAEGCAPIVVLSHLGLPDDRKLAEQVEGIDVIIGAHSHDLLPQGELVGNVLIAQAGNYAEHLGRVDMTVDEQGRVPERAAQVIPVTAEETPDPAVVSAIAEAEREVTALLAEVLGASSAPLELDYFEECGMGDMAADALREYMDAEIAIVASGLFHRGLPQGALTRADLNAACYSTANPYCTRLWGAQVRAALERGLDPAASRLEHGGLRGAPVGMPQISGLTVAYDPDAPTGERIRNIEVNGEPLDPARLYATAHTDAESDARIGYFVPDADQPSTSGVPVILGEVVEEYIRRHSPLLAPTGGRWRKTG
jgi:2',3'-cyclic-nucleotide 2'-phosphodiesterase (5'-nucleotidase family)